MGGALIGVFVALGLVHVLCLLGINTHSNVLPYSQVGWKRPQVRCSEILHLHLYCFCSDVARFGYHVLLTTGLGVVLFWHWTGRTFDIPTLISHSQAATQTECGSSVKACRRFSSSC